jgi:hypothetical protein
MVALSNVPMCVGWDSEGGGGKVTACTYVSVYFTHSLSHPLPIPGPTGYSCRSKLVLRTPTLRLFALVCALVWMTGLLTCAAWVGRSFNRESFKVLWPITVRYTPPLLPFTQAPATPHCQASRGLGVKSALVGSGVAELSLVLVRGWSSLLSRGGRTLCAFVRLCVCVRVCIC